MLGRVNIGEYDQQIVIKTETDTLDTNYGGKTTTWSTLATVFAKIEPASASEKYASDRETAFHDYTFTIRYLTGFDEKAVLTWDGNTFDILSISRPDRQHTLIIKGKRKEEWQ